MDCVGGRRRQGRERSGPVPPAECVAVAELTATATRTRSPHGLSSQPQLPLCSGSCCVSVRVSYYTTRSLAFTVPSAVRWHRRKGFCYPRIHLAFFQICNCDAFRLLSPIAQKIICFKTKKRERKESGRMQNSEVTFVVRLKQHGNGAQSPIAQSSRKFPSQPGYLIYAEIQCRTAASPFFGKEQGFGGIQAVVPALSWLHCGLRTAQRWCNKETFKNKSKN